MSNPDIQYFGSSGTWVKPPNAVRVDVVLKGGDGAAPGTVPGGGGDPLSGPAFTGTGTLNGSTGGGGGGGTAVYPAARGGSGPRVSVVCSPSPAASPVGILGSLSVDSYDADDFPAELHVEVGKGGRPGGRDGYALIVTHLASPSLPSVPPHDLMLHAHSRDHPDDGEPHEHLHAGPGHMGLEHVHPHRHASGEQ